MILWMNCHGKFATRVRLHRFGMVVNTQCVFCDKDETIDHLFLGYGEFKRIWIKVLRWLRIQHDPCEWDTILKWLLLHYRPSSTVYLSVPGSILELFAMHAMYVYAILLLIIS